MAAIAAAAVTKLFFEGSGEKASLYRIRGVTTGDTFDFSSDYSKVKCAVWGPAGTLATGVVGTVSANTTVTFTLGSLATDEIYVLVIGQA